MLRRDALLVYRRESEFQPNTAIQEAIINNNTALALQYVELDKNGASEDARTIINVVSAGNTALLLALKKGNMGVALAIIAHPHADVSLTDDNGLSALHWACMLRQDEVINALITKGANPSLPWSWEGCIGRLSLTPKALYEHQLDQSRFTQYYRSGALNADLFIDGRGYKIEGEEAYTDVIFHMRELCRNLNWVLNARFRADDDAVLRRECDLFRYNFGQGVNDFCINHNAIPVSRDIARLLTVPELRANVEARSEPISANGENADRIQAQEAAPIIISNNQLSEAENLNNSPVSLFFRPQAEAGSSSMALPARVVDSAAIAEALNHNSTTSLNGNYSWEVEETSRTYVLSCYFEAEVGRSVDRHQIYSDAQARIADMLPRDAAMGEEKNGESFIDSASQRSTRVVVAEFDQAGWDVFCRQLQAREHVSTRHGLSV